MARENTDLIKGIAAASLQQSSAIGEVTTAVREMDEMTQHNAALVEETNAAIEQTESQANELDRIVEIFVLADAPLRSPGSGLRAPQPGDYKTMKAIQNKPRTRTDYLASGSVALKQEWSEF